MKQSDTWVEFVRIERIGKQRTNRWSVNNRNGTSLGVIRYHGAWRRYVFFPADATLFEHTCLRDIATFCERESVEHSRKFRRLPRLAPLTSQQKAEG